MHTSGTTGLPKFCAQTHDYFARLAAAMSSALELTPADRVLAPLPLFHINPMGYGIITALLTGADALTVPASSPPAGSGRRSSPSGITVLILHAPPVEILKRATTAADADGHQVRTMFYADRDFLQPLRRPRRRVRLRLHRGRRRLTPAPVGPGDRRHPRRRQPARRRRPLRLRVAARRRAASSTSASASTPRCSTATSARTASTRPATTTAGSTPATSAALDGDRYLVFLERAAESIRVKGEFVPIPFVENHLAAVDGIADHALWKRKGALVDDEVVLYAVADPLPLDALRARIAELPAFMRPSAVARVAALPRDAAAGKVQRRLLTDHPGPRMGGARMTSAPSSCRLGRGHGRPARARRAQPAATARRRRRRPPPPSTRSGSAPSS